VSLADDLIVPEGRTLRVAAGTTVRVSATDATRTEPEYLSPRVEITVRGSLVIEGTREAPVRFLGTGDASPGAWAGILVDGGVASLREARIEGAETALWIGSGDVTLEGSDLRANRYGLVVAGPGARVSALQGTITDNDYGVVAVTSATLDVPRATVHGNRKADWHRYAPPATWPPAGPPPAPQPPGDPRLVGDEVLKGEHLWSGAVRVQGVVRVPEGSRLIIVPGTVIEFTRRDTNGDGLGENGLMVQGVVVAKGTEHDPIVFRSAERPARPGDWDAINLMNSEGSANLFEHCVFQHAYRALHFHFANVVVQGSWFVDNYRAAQFQESRVELRGNTLRGNRSGVQGRDSRVELVENVVSGNHLGAHLLRAAVDARGNTFSGNLGEGLRLRECTLRVTANLFDGGRFGLTLKGVHQGEVSGNVLRNQGEAGLTAVDSDNLVLRGNLVTSNGVSGASLRGSGATIDGNVFSHNGTRALGLTGFSGTVTGNGFADNAGWAVDLEDASDVDAPGNWWGPAGPAAVILDHDDDDARGRVRADRPLDGPFAFRWPLEQAPGDTRWEGPLWIDGVVTVPPGASLTLGPDTRVAFEAGGGLVVGGKILSLGEPGREVVFTARERARPGAWGEIRVERATGSAFRHTVFEHASWALHVHFSDLEITDCRFRANLGGLRFRSGPLRVERSRFEGNGVALRAYRGVGEIVNNLMIDNDVAIFVREGAGGLKVNGNDLVGNRPYGVRLGDFNTEDLDAVGNWWGPGDPEDAIFDDRDEPGIGRVHFQPARTAPAGAVAR